MADLLNLLKLLPANDEISLILEGNHEAKYVLLSAICDIKKDAAKIEEKLEPYPSEEASYLLQAVIHNYWERIHTGHFSEVALKTRQIYALANFCHVFYLLFWSSSKEQLEKCIETLDRALLIGCTQDLFSKSATLLAALMQFLHNKLAEIQGDAAVSHLPIISNWQRKDYNCDVPHLDCPSVEEFALSCFKPQQPALLLNTISHWSALEKWRDLNYLYKLAGNRTVPIEIGQNYTGDDWSQQLLKIRDFLYRQFGQSSTKTDIEYLAQHELFEQIPSLKQDFKIPDYCTLGDASISVDIKAWLGPKGTVSPLHFDPKHNLLCQVFGCKEIILAAPSDTPNLYPHPLEFLSNTSRIDAADVDFETFPLARNVRFYKLMLQAGDCLYMPPKWWHYVRSESESFSVSFWWE